MSEWQVVRAAPHWLTLNEGGWYWAEVKGDGCVHLYRIFNAPLPEGATGVPEGTDSCYFHICDIDDEIARLQRLRAAAIAHFGEDWTEQ